MCVAGLSSSFLKYYAWVCEMVVNLSEADYEILRILQENTRASISDISRELGLSRVTVRQRIQNIP